MSLVTFSNPGYRDKTVYAAAGSYTGTLMLISDEAILVEY